MGTARLNLYAPADGASAAKETLATRDTTDVYISADVETDGPIPGPYSMLSFALVLAGKFGGGSFEAPKDFRTKFYVELQPISNDFQLEALQVNGLDRDRLVREGTHPADAMTKAAEWVREVAGDARPVLVAYPLSFDWLWLYWYFVRFSATGSPFTHSGCFDLKTAVAVKGHLPIGRAGRKNLPRHLRPSDHHSHHALDDAIEQAEIFARVFEWKGENG
jgi:hypothetical protein